MTFELRFEQPVINATEVTSKAKTSPLVIKPALQGTFVWLSQRSGTFTPSQPLEMETTYEFSLAPGLMLPNGKPLQAQLHKTLRTPSFGLTAYSPATENTNSTSEPLVKLVFNANVDASKANGHIEFRDSAGRRIPADIQNTNDIFFYGCYITKEKSTRTWHERSIDNQLPSVSRRFQYENDDISKSNILHVIPKTPLPIGNEWKLVITRGLESIENKFCTREQQEIPIGNVTPFELIDVTPKNFVGHDPSIVLNFSKPLSITLTNASEASKWISIDPKPDNLKFDFSRACMAIRGSLGCQTNYTVTLKEGLPSEEPFSLTTNQSISVVMPPIAPRLYFPAFDCAQLANGKRMFELLTVNVPTIELRAKLIAPENAVFALQGYANYTDHSDDAEEPYKRIDYDMVPGKTVFNKEIKGSSQANAPQKLVLKWDDLLKNRKTGIVLLEAARGTRETRQDSRLGTQALVQLTDLGIVWKKIKTEICAYVFSHTTGQPVAGAQVRVITDENEIVGQSQTDTNGMAFIKGLTCTNQDWLAVQSGEDVHFVRMDDNKIPLYRFSLPWFDNSDESLRHQIFLFTDRELYRPNETAHLKAIARIWKNTALSIPTNLTGVLTCQDARNRKIYETNVTFSPFGSFSADIPLNSETRGVYQVVLKLGSTAASSDDNKEEHYYSFHVEDFQPSAFEITLKTKPEYGPNESLDIPLSARYYFGKPLVKAQLKWTLNAYRTIFAPKDFKHFSFYSQVDENGENADFASPPLTGQDTLTNAGAYLIKTSFQSTNKVAYPRAVVFLAEVTDVNQQTLSREASFTQHSSDFYLGLKTPEGMSNVGKEMPMEIVAVNNDGTPCKQPVITSINLKRIDWQTVKIQGAGRSVRYRNQCFVTNICERQIEVQPVVLSTNEDASVHGTPISGLVPPQAGEYLIVARATDSAGRKVLSTANIYVTGETPDSLAWNFRNDFQMTVKPVRSSYEVGETAELLVEAPFSGNALVTVERESVSRSFTIKLEGNAPLIRIPLEKTDFPNAFVSVTLIRGAEASTKTNKEPEFRVGYCMVNVKNPQAKLTVNIDCSATNYLPAQTVDVTVNIKDSQRNAVTNGEVILYAVDEGVLALTEAQTLDPTSIFWGPRPLAVSTSISLPGLLEEDSEQLRFGNKGYLGGGGGNERMRMNFLACAFWNATLTTDSNGTCHAAFPAPDSITRYRVIAVVHTLDNKFGTAQSAFQVSKPLLLEPALPRFANMTDRLLARAVVQNQTSKEGNVIVTLQLDNLVQSKESSSLPSRTVFIPAHGSTNVDFPVEFVEAGTSKWIWKCRFADESQGGFTDSVQSTINIHYPGPVLREILFSQTTNADLNFTTNANPQILEGKGTVTIELANTRLIGLSESIKQLLHYPYGCAEQTASTLLPWVVLGDQAEWSSLLSQETNNVQKAIRSGVSRLFSMQTQSGGLGYWPEDRAPMLWASAYGGLVLSIAQRHGIEVNKSYEYNTLLNYLSKQLRSNITPKNPNNDFCLAAYALAVAGKSEPAYHEMLFNMRLKLSEEARLFLALAISEAKGPHDMAMELLKPSPTSDSDENLMFFSQERLKAIRLLATVVVDPANTNINALVVDLMKAQVDGDWRTTQGNAWAMLALTEYSRIVEKNHFQATSDALLLCGNTTIPVHLNKTNCVISHTFPLAEAKNGIKLTHVEGPIYACAQFSARTTSIRAGRQDQGFGMQRHYKKITDSNTLEEITANNLHVGDRVLIYLAIITHKPSQFVVIDDPLPSNLEPINSNLEEQQKQISAMLATINIHEGDMPYCDFRQIQDDRVIFFYNNMRSETYLICYFARVRSAGTSIVPSLKIEEMYNPNRFGIGESSTISSQAME